MFGHPKDREKGCCPPHKHSKNRSPLQFAGLLDCFRLGWCEVECIYFPGRDMGIDRTDC